jgi:hypothetical protein
MTVRVAFAKIEMLFGHDGEVRSGARRERFSGGDDNKVS